MWELVRAVVRNRDEVENYLKEGYEPLTVTVDSFQGEVVWLKRKVEVIMRESNEIHYQQEQPVKGTGRRTLTDSKKEDSS